MRRDPIRSGALRAARTGLALVALLATLSIIAVLLPAWWCLAGPILPKDRSHSDDVLSLAGLTKVQIEVERLPRELEEHGITIEEIEAHMRRTLQGANISVAEHGKGPKLALMFGAAREKRVADALGLNIRVNLYQMVNVERLNRRFFVPTFTGFVVGLETNDHVEDAVNGGVNLILAKFLRAVRSAAVDAPASAG